MSEQQSGFDYAAYFRPSVLLQSLTTMPERKSFQSAPPVARPEPHRVVLYLGCNVLQTSHMISTVTDVLDLLGVDYVAVGGPAYCCGIVHHRNGDVERAESMGRNAVRYFETFQPEQVVIWCPSCIVYYDEIFEVPASFRTQHVTEFLAEHLGQFEFTREVRQRVALHHHTKGSRRQQEARAAESLLSAVPGLDLVEIGSDDRLGYTCSNAASETTVWQGIIDEQLRKSGELGAETFATLYHTCQRLICPFEEQYPLSIEHYLSVFARALGIEHEDKYKTYKLFRDPARVLAEVAPCMLANNVDLAQAREVVSQAFPAS
jgi:Fe-S oxidoreductase